MPVETAMETDTADHPLLDPWPATEAEARVVQERLRHRVVTHDDFGPLRRIAALDAHYSEADQKTWAAVAEIDAETLELTRSVLLAKPTDFPYVPGFLSFREVPAMAAALALLPEPPDLLVVDGQGLAHPRRLGLACHLGVVTGLPAIGVAKAHLDITLAGQNAVMNQGDGTAFKMRITEPGFEMGGKTGTSQVRRITMAERSTGVLKNDQLPWRQRDHALFVGFAPINAPRYACAVIVEHGGGGSAVAAPIARDLLLEVQRRDSARGSAQVSRAEPVAEPAAGVKPIAAGNAAGNARKVGG